MRVCDTATRQRSQSENRKKNERSRRVSVTKSVLLLCMCDVRATSWAPSSSCSQHHTKLLLPRFSSVLFSKPQKGIFYSWFVDLRSAEKKADIWLGKNEIPRKLCRLTVIIIAYRRALSCVDNGGIKYYLSAMAEAKGMLCGDERHRFSQQWKSPTRWSQIYYTKHSFNRMKIWSK